MSNHWVDEESAIAKRLKAALDAADWATLGAAAPVLIYEAKQIDLDPNVNSVALFVRSGSGSQPALGVLGFHRYSGVAIVWICVPDGLGTGVAKTIAGVVDDAFRSQAFVTTGGSKIECFTPYPTPPEVKEGILKIELNIPFKRDTNF